MAFYSKIPDYEIMEDEAPMTDYVRQNSIKLNNSELPEAVAIRKYIRVDITW